MMYTMLKFSTLIFFTDASLTCIQNIIDEQNAKHVLFIRDNNSSILNPELKFKATTWTSYTAGNEISDVINIRKYDFYLFQARGARLVETTLARIFENAQFKFECFVLVRLTGDADLVEMFRIFWRFYIFRVLIIDRYLKVYAYFPLTRGNCGEIQGIYVSTCVEFANTTVAFDRPEDVDFVGCSIRAYLRQMPPFVQKGDFNTNTGFIIKIFREIFQRLNLKAVTIPHNVTSGVIALPDGKMVNLMTKLPNGSYLGLAKDTIDRKCDILFITLGLNPAVDDFDYTYPLDFTKIRFYVPVAKPVEPWKNIFKVFNAKVWIGLLTVLIVFTPIWHAFSRGESDATLAYSFLTLVKTTVTAHDLTPRSDSFKILHLTWIVFTFLMISFYQSVLLSFIFQPSHETQITTIEQLSRSGIAIKSVKMLTRMLSEFEGEDMAEISRRIENVESLMSGPWKELLEDGAIAIFSADSVASVAAGAYKEHRAFAMDWGFVDRTIVLLARGSPFTGRINVVIKRLHESGLMERWMPRSVRRRVISEDALKAIGLKNFISALGVYVCGVALAFLVFCVELVCANCRRVVLPSNL